MTCRDLPPDEWPRLAGTELGEELPKLDPVNTRVIVVEDATGAIVGCWSLMRVWHAEGIWIAPEHRRGWSVARRLLTGLRRIVRLLPPSERALLTGANTPEVEGYLERLGATKVPASIYRWPEV